MLSKKFEQELFDIINYKEIYKTVKNYYSGKTWIIYALYSLYKIGFVGVAGKCAIWNNYKQSKKIFPHSLSIHS